MGSMKPLRILCGREIQKSIRDSVKRLLDDKIRANGLEDFYESTDTEIRGKNGTLFIFSGFKSNINSIKSMEGIDILWGEEAQDISSNTLEVLIPTIRKKGSMLIFTWNPRFEDDPIDHKFRAVEPPPRTFIKEVNYHMNPWFPDELRQEMEYDKGRDYDKYLHIWEGKYLTNSETRVFKNWKVEDFETPDNTIFRFGADWGFAADPTVLIRCYTAGQTLYIDYEAHMVGCEIVNTPDLFFTVPEAEKWPMCADGSRPETISHMKKNGFPKIFPAVKGKGSIEDGVEWLKSYNIVVHPRCKHTIDELTMYSYKKDEKTDKILPVFEDKNNHLIDALRYAFEAERRKASTKQVKKVMPMPVASRW